MKYILPIIILGIFGSSCKKTLEENPQSIAAEKFYTTPAEVEAGLNAVYTPLRDGGGLGALYLAQVEIYSEYMYGRGSHAPLNNYQGLDNTNITRVATMWSLFYLSIRNANIMIRKIPLAKSVSDDAKTKYLAEARYMRALNYFYLVRNWAGVPIRSEQNMDSINVKRNTAAEVYNLILADLQFAETNLPDIPRLIGAPSKWAARTVLADVYMNLGRYDDADTEAKTVIGSNKFSLVKVSTVPDFDKLYGPDIVTSTEEIFYLKFSRTTSGQGFQYPIYAFYPNSGYYPPGGFYTFYSDSIANPFMKTWDKHDLRWSYNWYSQTFGLGATTVLNKKFTDKLAVTAAGNDYPMYRYADLLLLYAEAESRINNGPTADAMEKLNMIHRRAYGKDPSMADPAFDFSLADYNASSFLDLVVRERGYEDCSEAKRWLDLKRMGIAKQTILAVKGITVADKHLLWPIPTTEYNYNKAIDPVKDQNPGY